MTGEDYDKWLEENCTSHSVEWINGIQYCFGKMHDGWVAIFEINNGQFLPKIQAKDMEHAISWCTVREPITVPVNII